MTNQTSPHEAEYLAAVEGMNETYGKPARRSLPAVGDFVSGISGGKRWSGHVEWVEDSGRMVINVGGGWVAVSPNDITH